MVTRAIGVTSAWDLVPDDADLYKDVFQEHFADSGLQVIAIFKALKVSSEPPNQGSTTVLPRRSRASGGDTRILRHQVAAEAVESLRILIVTVDVTAAPPNGKPSVHKFGVSFETGSLQYSPRGAPMGLNLLKAIHILPPPPGSSLANVLGTMWAAKPKSKDNLPTLPQGFLQPTTNATPIHYAFPTASRRVTCACCFFCVARTFSGRTPRLHGMNIDFVDGWVRRNAAERPSNVVPSPLERLAFLHGTQHRDVGNEWARLSEKDEVHMTGLLEIVKSTGALEVEVLRERLEAEYAALEAANVHAILDSAVAVPRVLEKINGAFNKLEDLDCTLGVFDGKLSVMREDIATIESRNNSLETQTRSLDRLRVASTDLLRQLTAKRSVQVLKTEQLSERTMLPMLIGLNDLRGHLDSLKAEDGGSEGLKREVLHMRMVSDFKQQLEELSQVALNGCRSRLDRVFSGEFLTNDRVPQLAAVPPGLAFAPLLHLLPFLPGGHAVLSDLRTSCITTMSLSLNGLVRFCATAAEKAVASGDSSQIKSGAKALVDTAVAMAQATGRSPSVDIGSATSAPALNMFQNILPTLTHCLVYAVDLLRLRHLKLEDSTSTNTASKTELDVVALALSKSKQANPPHPLLTLSELLRPKVAISDAGRDLLARVTSGMKDPVRRLTRAIGANSFVPLVSLIATIQAWRKHISLFPAAAPLSSELREVYQDALAELERHQANLVSAVERQDASKTGFAADRFASDKAVKELGVLPRTKQLAADCMELAALIRGGLPALQWSWPGVEMTEVMSSESVSRRMHEPAAKVIHAVYTATMAHLAKVSDKDPKNGARPVMENLAVIEVHLRELSRLTPELKVCITDLDGNLQRAQKQYVSKELQNSKIWPAIQLSGKLHSLLRDVSPADVQFQAGFSPSGVAATVEGALQGVDKRLKDISSRVKKHLSGNLRLQASVWSEVQEGILGPLNQLEQDAMLAFPDITFSVRASQVSKMLEACKP